MGIPEWGEFEPTHFPLPNDTDPYLNGYTPPTAEPTADHDDEEMGNEAMDQVSALPDSVGGRSTDAVPQLSQTSAGPSSLPLTSPPSLVGAPDTASQMDPSGGDIANIADLEGMICTMETRSLLIPLKPVEIC